MGTNFWILDKSIYFVLCLIIKFLTNYNVSLETITKQIRVHVLLLKEKEKEIYEE